MTSQVQRLQARGWADRVVDPVDGRAVLVSLSGSGRAVLDDVRAWRTAAVAPVVERLSGADRERLHQALDVLGVLLATASRTPTPDAGSDQFERSSGSDAALDSSERGDAEQGQRDGKAGERHEVCREVGEARVVENGVGDRLQGVTER